MTVVCTRHFHVLVDVASCLLNLSNQSIKTEDNTFYGEKILYHIAPNVVEILIPFMQPDKVTRTGPSFISLAARLQKTSFTCINISLLSLRETTYIISRMYAA